ncbi:MAG: phosphoribosyltransferase family protein, partial [Armatimonadota bacterium]|nr:phosphoribosyltransferase family protein [Armatimonadota bacterium]
MIFEDRVDAGRKLGEALKHYRDQDVIILAVPRGGVVVGYEVARALNAPLDVVIPRKIGAPGQPELAIGAIAIDEKPLLDHQMINLLGVSAEYIEAEVRHQKEEIERRRKIYRNDRSFPDLRGKTVILVDDGIATGYTMMAAAHAIRRMQP